MVISLFMRAVRRGHAAALRLWPLVHPLPHRSWSGDLLFHDRGIDWTFHELSSPAADQGLSRQLLNELVLDARTDRDLFNLALGARCQAQARLLEVAVNCLASHDSEHRARAARLLGWLSATEAQRGEIARRDESLWVRRPAERPRMLRRREA